MDMLFAAMKYERIETATELFVQIEKELENVHCGNCG
jgi:hypothetical protein